MGQRARAAGAFLLLLVSAWILGTWVVRAWYARWVADDFCFAAAVTRHGFWRSQLTTYLTWNGRFTATFLASVLTSAGPAIARWFAIGAMAVWVVAASRAARSAAIGIGLVAAIVNAAPDAYQPLIWTTGLVTYGLPVIGATILAAIIESPAVLLFPLALMFGGCSEVAAIAQAVFAGALAFVVPRLRRQLVAIATGSAVAFAIAAAAPGNLQRRALFHPLPIGDAALAAIAATPSVYAQILVEGCTLFVPLIVLIALSKRWPAPPHSYTPLLASIAILAATLFAGLAGTGRLPWGRVQFVPVAYVAAALTLVALALRIERYPAIAIVAAAVFAAVGVVTTVETRLDEIREARQFAALADRVATAQSAVVAAPHDFDYLEFVTRDPKFWSNRCIADYYRLSSIRSSR